MIKRALIISIILFFTLGSLLIIERAFGQENQFEEEFESFDDTEFSETIESSDVQHTGTPKGFKYGLGALLFTLFAVVMVRFRTMRYFRSIFLLGSLVILGFMNGGCPCSISSFQNLWLLLMGQEVHVHSLVWFLGLIPLTYLFGKVWCGWVCHLGAFQEFLYRANNLKSLKGEGVQKTLRILQYTMFATLMIQLMITKTNIFIHYDPFKVAFNLRSFHTLGWVLLGLLLLTSLFIYRPFCRGVCPVGLVLGWVSKIPGALKLATTDDCSSCRLCKRGCLNQAIDASINFSAGDCIMCGECLDKCKKNAICFNQKGENK